MSRDSRLIRSHLHQLALHLEAHNAEIEAAAERAHAELDAKRGAAADAVEPHTLQLPDRPVSETVDH